jgi:pantetheine-phosphate adenylyltransferase
MENSFFQKPFGSVGLGGTFDHLHEGHKELIRMASHLGEKIYVGLTEPCLTRHKRAHEKIENYSVREDKLINYLENELCLPQERYEILSLKDFSGPSLNDETLRALICSTETYPNAEKINHFRRRRHKDPLIIIVIPLIQNSKGKKLSSTDIRLSLNDSEERKDD